MGQDNTLCERDLKFENSGFGRSVIGSNELKQPIKIYKMEKVLAPTAIEDIIVSNASQYAIGNE